MPESQIETKRETCVFCGENFVPDVSDIIRYENNTGCEWTCPRCYDQNYSRCEYCCCDFPNEDLRENDNGSLVCRECRENESDEENGLQEFDGAVSLRGGRGRKIGVEIETSYQSRKAHNKICEAQTWSAVHDGSISGIEYNSPKLAENNYEREISNFCNSYLRFAKVDSACGLHIHLDASDLSWFEVALIYAYCQKHQEWFFSLQPRSRQDNDYCLRLPKMPLPKTKQELTLWLYGAYIKKQRGKYPQKQNGGMCDRHFWLNIHSYFYRRTLEIRLHSGTTQAYKIINWIKAFLIVIDYARQKHEMEFAPSIIISNRNPDLAKYFLDRQEVMSLRGKQGGDR